MTTTDDTRQRTVAEIIGWDEVASWCRDPGGPTPDDMLDWLLRRGWGLADAAWIKELPDEIQYIVSLHNRSEDNSVNGQGDTLHAALEAAVRAVAEVGA